MRFEVLHHRPAAPPLWEGAAPREAWCSYEYVACDSTAAETIAELLRPQLSPGERIEVRGVDAEIVHTKGSWAYWSDGVVTTSREHYGPFALIPVTRGLPRLPETHGLEPGAVDLIGAAIGSDSGVPACGWKHLAEVATVLAERDLARGGSRGVYGRDTLTEMSVEYRDGTRGKLYVRSGGYAEGYSYEVSVTPPEDLEGLQEVRR